MLIETNKGWNEAIVDDNCGFDRFYKAAEILEKNFDIKFSDQLDDFDSLYWDFNYKGSALVLHYHIYCGVSIFPKKFKLATPDDNETVIEIGTLLIKALDDK
jgi:hypothetical protein